MTNEHPPVFFVLVSLALLSLSACQPPAPGPAVIPASPLPSPSPLAIPHSPLPSPSPFAIPQSPSPVTNPQSPAYTLLFSIPVEVSGVQYHGVEAGGTPITGPNALAALPDGSLVIADLLGNRLLNYSLSGKLLEAFDLSTIDVVNVSDLVARQAELYLLEVSLNASPVRCRVDRLARSLPGGWALARRYEINPGVCSEGGLSGIFIDGSGRLLLEVAGGSQVFLLADASQTATTPSDSATAPPGSTPPPPPAPADGYSYFGRLYRVQNGHPGQNPRYQAGDVTVQTVLSHGLGGFRFLDAFPDGRSYLVRDDVVNDQNIQTDQTVSLIGADGLQRSVARFPASESLYYIYRNLAVGPDEAVYGLLPRAKTLEVIRLNFFRNLPPIIPTAAEPVITLVTLP